VPDQDPNNPRLDALAQRVAELAQQVEVHDDQIQTVYEKVKKQKRRVVPEEQSTEHKQDPDPDFGPQIQELRQRVISLATQYANQDMDFREDVQQMLAKMSKRIDQLNNPQQINPADIQKFTNALVLVQQKVMSMEKAYNEMSNKVDRDELYSMSKKIDQLNNPQVINPAEIQELTNAFTLLQQKVLVMENSYNELPSIRQEMNDIAYDYNNINRAIANKANRDELISMSMVNENNNQAISRLQSELQGFNNSFDIIHNQCENLRNEINRMKNHINTLNIPQIDPEEIKILTNNQHMTNAAIEQLKRDKLMFETGINDKIMNSHQEINNKINSMNQSYNDRFVAMNGNILDSNQKVVNTVTRLSKDIGNNLANLENKMLGLHDHCCDSMNQNIGQLKSHFDDHDSAMRAKVNQLEVEINETEARLNRLDEGVDTKIKQKVQEEMAVVDSVLSKTKDMLNGKINVLGNNVTDFTRKVEMSVNSQTANIEGLKQEMTQLTERTKATLEQYHEILKKDRIPVEIIEGLNTLRSLQELLTTTSAYPKTFGTNPTMFTVMELIIKACNDLYGLRGSQNNEYRLIDEINEIFYKVRALTQDVTVTRQFVKEDGQVVQQHLKQTSLLRWFNVVKQNIPLVMMEDRPSEDPLPIPDWIDSMVVINEHDTASLEEIPDIFEDIMEIPIQAFQGVEA
jgi:hypothetical protein